MTTQTFQQTFTAQIANIVFQAYNSGLLQYHPLVIADMTFTMNMFTHHNMLTVQFNGKLLSVSMYDTDSEETQFTTVQNLIADMLM